MKELEGNSIYWLGDFNPVAVVVFALLIGAFQFLHKLLHYKRIVEIFQVI